MPGRDSAFRRRVGGAAVSSGLHLCLAIFYLFFYSAPKSVIVTYLSSQVFLKNKPKENKINTSSNKLDDVTSLFMRDAAAGSVL